MMMIKMKKVRVGEKFNLIDCEFVEVPWTLTWKYFDRNFESTGEERFNKYLKTDWKNEKLREESLEREIETNLSKSMRSNFQFSFTRTFHSSTRLILSSSRALGSSAYFKYSFVRHQNN